MSKVTVLPPDGKESIVLCLESGHSCFVKNNDGKGTEIPARFQQRAVREGCVINTSMKNVKDDSGKTEDIQDKVIAAIASLTPEEYNTSGFPELNAVTEKAGFKVSKAQLTKAFEAYQATHRE